LGLFGLSSFTIAQRTKEVSIRKVLGAGIVQIIALVSKQYVWLVLISFALAAYPAYYLSNMWLQEYAYRIDMPYLLYPGSWDWGPCIGPTCSRISFPWSSQDQSGKGVEERVVKLCTKYRQQVCTKYDVQCIWSVQDLRSIS
jgi:hypothetical protein